MALDAGDFPLALTLLPDLFFDFDFEIDFWLADGLSPLVFCACAKVNENKTKAIRPNQRVRVMNRL